MFSVVKHLINEVQKLHDCWLVLMFPSSYTVLFWEFYFFHSLYMPKPK